MKVAQLTTWSYPHIGGVELHVKRLSEELEKIGVTVEIFSYNKMPHNRNHLPFSIRVPGLPYELGTLPLPSALKKILTSNADIIHCHAYGHSMAWIATITKLVRSKPIVYTTHGDPYSRIYGAWDLGRAIPARHANRVIALTEQEAQHLRETGVDPSRIRVIPNGFDGIDGATISSRPIETPYILCVGRVDFRHKGQDILIEAYKQLSIDHKLVFIGTGPDLHRLRERTRSMQGVLVLGPLKDAEKNEWMSNADLVIIPSRTEAFGIVALEAMIRQRRLVVTRVGGLQHITEGYALAADPTPDSLSRTILNGLDSPVPPIPAQLNQLYSWSNIADKVERVYAELV